MRVAFLLLHAPLAASGLEVGGWHRQPSPGEVGQSTFDPFAKVSPDVTGASPVSPQALDVGEDMSLGRGNAFPDLCMPRARDQGDKLLPMVVDALNAGPRGLRPDGSEPQRAFAGRMQFDIFGIGIEACDKSCQQTSGFHFKEVADFDRFFRVGEAHVSELQVPHYQDWAECILILGNESGRVWSNDEMVDIKPGQFMHFPSRSIWMVEPATARGLDMMYWYVHRTGDDNYQNFLPDTSRPDVWAKPMSYFCGRRPDTIPCKIFEEGTNQQAGKGRGAASAQGGHAAAQTAGALPVQMATGGIDAAPGQARWEEGSAGAVPLQPTQEDATVPWQQTGQAGLAEDAGAMPLQPSEGAAAVPVQLAGEAGTAPWRGQARSAWDAGTVPLQPTADAGAVPPSPAEDAGAAPVQWAGDAGTAPWPGQA